MQRLSLLLVIAAWIVSSAAGAETSPQTTIVSLDNDLITLMKIAIWVGGIFLSIFALIGIVFFGWDVHKARNSIIEAEKEIMQQVARLRSYSTQWDQLNEKFEQLGAQFEELTAPSQPATNREAARETSSQGGPGRSTIDLIRDVISSSSYDWTTVGRIIKKTGLSREEILSEIRSAGPDIEISFGRKSQDHIFRFKKK